MHRISGQTFSKILLNIGKCFQAVAYCEKQNSVEEKSETCTGILKNFCKKNFFTAGSPTKLILLDSLLQEIFHKKCKNGSAGGPD